MTTAHHVAGWAVVAVTVALLVGAIWSWLASRRSDGRRDHRFAVDRLVLVVVAAVGVAVLQGLLVVASGSRPGEPLHILYAVLALVALPAAWTLGGRPGAGAGSAGRRRRDAWVVVAAVVMLGIELRLFLTG
jgi:hypothetical protein